MKASASLYYEVRGLRYHVRRWAGGPGRRVVLLHGWMDVSASFQFLVDALPAHWDVVAPDWRGYGLSDWGKSDCYWFPDYLADLDALLEHISPQAPVDLVGHSLGGNVACLYAGVRPARIRRLVNLEGFGMPETQPEQATGRYARWLDELGSRKGFRPYADFAALAERMRKSNPRLTRERADFLARHWGRELPDGQVQLRGDPAHKIVYPLLYRYEEARACWREVTAPVLWVEAAESKALERVGLDAAQVAERRAAFRDLRYVTVSNAGHMLHHDQPEQVARLLEDFLSAP
jgi:pimeloyl-ACP methyl ester carboxylesterase